MRQDVTRFLTHRHHLHWAELAPYAAAIAVLALAPLYLPFATQIAIMALLALSLDLALGFAGIATLGHAALFGSGAYVAGLLSVHLGWNEPFSGLALAGLAGAAVAAVSGLLLLRSGELAMLALSIATAAVLYEIANHEAWATGGFDGLVGIAIAPLFGRFEFDFDGYVGFIHVLAVLALAHLLVRTIIHSSFGLSLKAIHANRVRMEALGAPVRRRLLGVYMLSGGLAGLAGALQTQTTGFVANTVLGFELSAAVTIMLTLGGVGRLYGAFVGAAVYMLLQDWLAKLNPEYWMFWLGCILILTVLFMREGLVGMLARFRRTAR